jgi:delta14-sterol reductase
MVSLGFASNYFERGGNGLTMIGTWTILLALAITAGICSQPGGIELYTYLYDHWIPLTSAALVNATFQAIFVYVNSFYSGELLALGGNSGVFFYDVSTLSSIREFI